MISHGSSKLTTHQLIDRVAVKLSTKEYNDALTLIDQCDNLDDIDFKWTALDGRGKGLTLLHLLVFLASAGGNPKIVSSVFKKLKNKPLDFNMPAENEQDKGITPLWLACLAASNGHPEGFDAILEALPLELISTLDFNKPAKNEHSNGKTPLWLACLAALKSYPEALMTVIQKISYRSLDFDLILNFGDTEENLYFFISNVKELSQAMAQLSDDNLLDGITTLEQLSKIEIEDKPHMKWVVEIASTEIIFALLNRDISKTGEKLDPSMFMFDILRTQAIELALNHACALSDESLKAHCVRKLLNISPNSSAEKDNLDWVCKYKNAQDIIQATSLYKDKQRDLELLEIKSKLEETKSELEAKDAIIQEMQTEIVRLNFGHSTQSESKSLAGSTQARREPIIFRFQSEHSSRISTSSRSHPSMDSLDAHQAPEHKKHKPKN